MSQKGAFDTIRWAGGAREPFELHKSARQALQPSVVTAIRVANVLDLRLYTVASELYHQRRAKPDQATPSTPLRTRAVYVGST
jgi:hypothetical protein